MHSVSAVLALLFSVNSFAAAEEPRKLVVICIDGLDARYLKDADRLHLKIPTLRKLMREGMAAEGEGKMAPDASWPASATIVTGVAPAKHMIANSETPTQTIKGQTLWQAAIAAHRKTALLNWPATVGAEADYVCPQFWEGHFTVDPPFDAIAQKCTAGLVQRIAKTYPTFMKAKWSDASALQALRYLLEVEKPDLTLVHLLDLEGEESETGALSLYSRDVLENDDDLLGQALAKRPPRTIVAIVSDHGFDTENYVVRPKVLAASNAVEMKYGLVGAMDAKAAAALRKWIGNKKMGIAREVSLAEVKKSVPEVAGWKAAFVTMPGYVAIDGANGKAVGQGSHKGVPSAWLSRAAFVLNGDGVKPGKVGEVSMLDIAPTFAGILGVSLHEAHGKSLLAK